jgi:hypothetical protein
MLLSVWESVPRLKECSARLEDCFTIDGNGEICLGDYSSASLRCPKIIFISMILFKKQIIEKTLYLIPDGLFC